MNFLQSIILGIIQGLSEFIPISSTAHLTLAGRLMGIVGKTSPEQWTAFIAVIQLGTLLAVLLYFRKDIVHIALAFVKENLNIHRRKFSDQSPDSRMGWMVIIGSLPIVTIGLLLKKLIESSLTKDPAVIAGSLIFFGVILWLAEKTARLQRNISQSTIIDSIVVGLAQCLALVPGASRSGTTITASLFMGLKREDGARFSFLLSIPAVFGSGMLEFVQSLKFIHTISMGATLTATIAAAVSGYFAIAFLINFLKTRTTTLFVVYRILLGGLIFILLAFGML